jgi:hypothetical protein
MPGPVSGEGAGGIPGVTGAGTGGSDGVLGITDTGTAIVGSSTGTGAGVSGTSPSSDGVRGTNGLGSGSTPAFGCGVQGQSANGYGVYGASNTASGVYGETASQSSYGVTGINNSAYPCTAILGSSSNGHGVRGTNGTGSGKSPHAAGAGVWGDSDQGIGIFGASKSGSAGMFEGNVTVTGKINVTNVAVTDDINVKNVAVTGNITVAGDVMLTGADCAEQFDLNTLEIVEPGTVMVIDDNGSLRRSERAYDRRVAGVVSGAGDFRPGIVLDRRAENQGRTTIALVGKVYCKVDADLGPIAVGDLLTSSDTPGHAMKVTDPTKGFGSVIGKALRPLESGRSLLPILVALQ